MWIRKVAVTPMDSMGNIVDSLQSNSRENAPSIHAVNEAILGWFRHSENTNESHIANNQSVELAPRITIEEDGLYIMIGYVEWQGVSGGVRSLRLDRNEGNMSDYVTIDASGNNALRQQITYIHALNKDDVVSLGVRQTSGDTINITYRKLTIFKLSSNTFAE